MKTSILSVALAAFIGAMALSAPALAQTKTVKACEDEWKANKAANQAAKITQKAYVEKCRAGAAAKPAAAAKPETKPAAKPVAAEKKPAAKPAAAASSEKTVKACEDEWKANKAANQAAKITEKAYVEKCRAGGSMAKPAAAPAPAPAAQAKPAAPAASAAKTVAATASGKPAGANQYAAESQAKGHCPSDTVVWANLDSKIFHFVGHSDYGKTKSGAYMCEKDATSQGMRAAKNEKHP